MSSLTFFWPAAGCEAIFLTRGNPFGKNTTFGLCDSFVCLIVFFSDGLYYNMHTDIALASASNEITARNAVSMTGQPWLWIMSGCILTLFFLLTVIIRMRAHRVSDAFFALFFVEVLFVFAHGRNYFIFRCIERASDSSLSEPFKKWRRQRMRTVSMKKCAFT